MEDGEIDLVEVASRSFLNVPVENVEEKDTVKKGYGKSSGLPLWV